MVNEDKLNNTIQRLKELEYQYNIEKTILRNKWESERAENIATGLHCAIVMLNDVFEE